MSALARQITARAHAPPQANEAPDDIKIYRAAGADGYVSKSASVKSLHVQVCRFADASESDRFQGRLLF